MNKFQIGPLSLTVEGYAHEASDDFYQSNWLRIDVACVTEDGDVAFQSACLMTSDIFDFLDEAEAMLAGEGRQAYLVSLEPQVDVQIARGDGPDMFALDIELTPNVDDDEDIYGVATQIARDEVKRIAEQAKVIIEAFPVRGISKS